MHSYPRRTLLGQLVAAGVALGDRAFAQQRPHGCTWQPPPVGARACAPTGEDIEGPYYLPGAPERSVLLEPGMEGTPLELAGTLVSSACEPLAHTRVELWQCDARGRYDTVGTRLRATLATDARGSFLLRTIVPGRYRNGAQLRPAHLHLKLHGPRGVRTTQLYFEGDPHNATDPWFRQDRALALAPHHDGVLATVRLVVPA